MSAGTEELVGWVDRIVRDGVNLTVKEEEFIESMQAKVERFGDRAVFSQAQADWIEDIYTKRVP
jgi:hypothetical protein